MTVERLLISTVCLKSGCVCKGAGARGASSRAASGAGAAAGVLRERAPQAGGGADRGRRPALPRPLARLRRRA